MIKADAEAAAQLKFTKITLLTYTKKDSKINKNTFCTKSFVWIQPVTGVFVSLLHTYDLMKVIRGASEIQLQLSSSSAAQRKSELL